MFDEDFESIDIELTEDEVCMIVTEDGEFIDIAFDCYQEVLERADAIREMMALLMEFDCNKDGIKFWYLSKDLETVIMDTDDD